MLQLCNLLCLGTMTDILDMLHWIYSLTFECRTLFPQCELHDAGNVCGSTLLSLNSVIAKRRAVAVHMWCTGLHRA